MKDNIVSRTFYLTSLFADIKSDHKWTTNEAKLAMLIISELSSYKIFLPDIENTDDAKLEIDNLLSKVPKEYSFTRTKFKEITNTSSSVVSREIKKTVKGLLTKTMIMPHPLEEDDSMSVYGVTWFNKIEYSNKTGQIKIRLNEESIIRLVAFAKYSKISFDSIIKIQNHNSIHSYLFFKILRDSSKYKELDISILEFKEKIGLKNKYKEIKHLKIYVLDVIENDINNFTELNISYDLIKEGRSYTRIKFKFDYKNTYENETIEKDPSSYFDRNTLSVDDMKSPFEQIFKSWGISNKKIEEIEYGFSLKAISDAIEVTERAIQDGKIEKSPSGYFLNTLENKQLQEDVVFEQVQENLRKEQEKNERKALASEYDAIQKFINDNDEELSKYLSAKSLGTEYPLDNFLKEEISNLSCVGADKFKNFRPKLSVLERGYFDSIKGNIVRPNMYTFLILIKNSEE